LVGRSIKTECAGEIGLKDRRELADQSKKYVITLSEIYKKTSQNSRTTQNQIRIESSSRGIFHFTM